MGLTSNNSGSNYAVFKTVEYSGGTGFSTTIKSGFGQLSGIFISEASGTPTMTIFDGTDSSGTVILPTFVPTAGQSIQFSSPVLFQDGLHAYSGGSVKGVVVYY